MMAGLPGSGKSTLARAVAAELGGAVLDKDVIRSSVFPQRWTEYSTEQDDFVVELMLLAAQYLLRRNPATVVILDGRPFGKKYQVERVASFAKLMKTPCRLVECVCSEKVALGRLKADRKHVAGNRDAKLYREIKAGFQEIRRRKLVVKTGLGLEACVERVVGYLQLK